MRACVRLDDRVCSRWFAVEQGLRQGCVLAPLLFNIFFAAVINVASTHFKADNGIMDALVHLRKKKGAGGRGEATAGESVLATPLWGMLYADDARVSSQSPEQLRKMMGVVFMVPNRVTCEMVLDGGEHFIPAGIDGFHTKSLSLASRVVHDRATEDTHTHTGKEHKTHLDQHKRHPH